MGRRLVACLLAVVLVSAGLIIRPGLVFAATWTVDTTSDGRDSDVGDGVCYAVSARGCTLRAAVMESDSHPGSAKIVLGPGTYRLTSTLSIEDGVTIRGAGAAQTVISGGDKVLPLWVHSVSYLVCDRDRDRLVSLDRNGGFRDVWSTSGAGQLKAPVAAHLVGNDDLDQVSTDVLVTGTSGVHRFTAGGRAETRLLDAPSANIPFPADAVAGPSDDGSGPSDRVFVADYAPNGRVLRMSATGGGRTTIIPNGRGGLVAPSAIAFHHNTMYVVDSGGNAVRRYRPSGSYLGSSPTGNAPDSILFLPDGSFVVSNSGTDDVSRFSASGQLQGLLISGHSGGLDGPRGMALGPDGSLLVISSNTGQILQYDLTTGAYERVFASTSSHLSQPSCLLRRDQTADGPLVGLYGLTVTGGQAAYGYPGGILVDPGARLHVYDSVVTGNTGSTFGGGIGNYGHLLLRRTAVTGNTLPQGGGGVTSSGGGVFSTGLLVMDHATISGNTATRGGGLDQGGGTVTITDSTISDNVASGGSGGGLRFTGGKASLGYATITANSSVFVQGGDASRVGGGLDNEGGQVTMSGSVLAGNTDGRERGVSGYSPDCFAPADFVSERANLVGVLTSRCKLADSSTHRAGTGNLLNVDPGLDDLAAAPGFTFGVHPVSGSDSAVVGAAHSSHAPCPVDDQVGVARPSTHCDIGAVQFAR